MEAYIAFLAAQTGDEATLAAYLAAGGAADICNRRGESLLALAILGLGPEARRAMALQLLAAGAGPGAAEDALPPLACALALGEEELAAVLLEAGAPPLPLPEERGCCVEWDREEGIVYGHRPRTAPHRERREENGTLQ